VTGNRPGQNSQAITADPGFRNPVAGNFFLLPTSGAIDLSRSEIGPTVFGDMLYPSVNINQSNLAATPIRNVPVFTGGIFGALDQTQPAGDINTAGGLGFGVALGGGSVLRRYRDPAGEPVNERGFPDQWIPVLTTSTLGSGTTAANPATFNYAPITGERDQAGNLRVKDPNSPNIGFGSRPFFDLGAFEYIIQNPPVVDAVVSVNNTTVQNIYGVGTVAGTNTLPQSIQLKFNERLDPSTLTGSSVILLASGGDGIFGNSNSAADRVISLAGKLSFDPNTDILTIDTSGIFTSTATANDEYRLILKGTGSSVIRDTNGLALDGFNILNGNQLPLPSGSDQFPGSDFQVTFTIDTHPPSIVGGSFILDPASDTSGGLSITKINTPTVRRDDHRHLPRPPTPCLATPS